MRSTTPIENIAQQVCTLWRLFMLDYNTLTMKAAEIHLNQSPEIT